MDALIDPRLGTNAKLSGIDRLTDWSRLEALVSRLRPGRPPDETTLCRFRAAAAGSGVLEHCFAEINRQLDAQGQELAPFAQRDVAIPHWGG